MSRSTRDPFYSLARLKFGGKRRRKRVATQPVVLFSFKESASAEDIQGVADAFAALPSKIDVITSFQWGPNNSPENPNDGFTRCFMVTFDSEEGREAYLPHADHKAFVEVLKPVVDKVRVLDFWEP